MSPSPARHAVAGGLLDAYQSPNLKPLTGSTLSFVSQQLCGLDLQNNLDALVKHNRLLLMELGCAPTSLLTAAVQEMSGRSSAAVRASGWNVASWEPSGEMLRPEHTAPKLTHYISGLQSTSCRSSAPCRSQMRSFCASSTEAELP